MELLKGIFADDLFLYLADHHTFILSDIHIGYEESLNRQGILVPRHNYDGLKIRIEKSLEHIRRKGRIERIILNGDVVHEFGKVRSDEKQLTKRFISFLKRYSDVIVIEGNHDRTTRFFLKDDAKIEGKFIVGDILIMHGDKIPPKEDLKGINTIIIGHEHPSVGLTSGPRTEKFKCFLKGRYRRKGLIVMPSCNLFLEGTDILREKTLSPLLKDVNVLDFEVYVIEDKIYDFGKVKGLLDQR